MARPKIQVGVIVDGPNRHPITPDGEDKRGVQTAVPDLKKKSPYLPVVERDNTEKERPMNFLLTFYNEKGEEVSSRSKEYENSDEAHLAYDTAVADLDQGNAGTAVKVTFSDGGRITKQHGVPTAQGTPERVEAERLEREGDGKKTEDEKRTEQDRADRDAFATNPPPVPEEVRNPDAGTLPPHDPNPGPALPKTEVKRTPKVVDPFNTTVSADRVNTPDGPKVVKVKTETKKP